MGVIGFPVKPRKYDYRSGYLKGRKDAMMERVKRICKDNGFEMNIKPDSTPLIKRVDFNVDNKFYFGLKVKTRYLLIVLILVFLFYLLNYLLRLF